LAGRKANLFDRQQAFVMEDVAVNHAYSSILIVAEMRSRNGVPKRIGHGAVCKKRRKGKAPFSDKFGVHSLRFLFDIQFA
jgi:hypothetical protein